MCAPKTTLPLLLAAFCLALGAGVAAQPSATATAQPHGAVTTAAAESPPGKAPLRQVDAAFARADSNHDGKLSRSEAERLPAISLRFDQFDLNKDQFLSREEFDNALTH
ncbi:EF-hand domain-containing protein [Polaromonas sp.]|uniref:EF-hand domain-containing protein n=1 Tax=Polaromonas sp. TaxID=1869339 RepID=UPI00286D3DAD|nr:EF-hand domain-containing protein [Polaromonas sp.]